MLRPLTSVELTDNTWEYDIILMTANDQLFCDFIRQKPLFHQRQKTRGQTPTLRTTSRPTGEIFDHWFNLFTIEPARRRQELNLDKCQYHLR
jgi:hypothetical protein